MITEKVQGATLRPGMLLKGIGCIFLISEVGELLKIHIRGTEPILLGKEQDIEILIK